MRSDFCAFILTHGRPDKVFTYETLKRCGYTGKIYIVIDDEDKAAGQYRKKFGDAVIQFKKSEVAKTFDEGDNFNDRRAIIYARNVSFDLAEKVGCKYFIQLDDDYQRFDYRFDDKGFYCQKLIYSLDSLFGSLVEYLAETPFGSVAIGQSGDYIGGQTSTMMSKIQGKRKAMNSFVCDISKRFQFVGRINEDVNTYTCEQRRGLPFVTILGVSLTQKQTQSNSGGMTDLYLDSGTYVKSFYSVMYAPSCVKVKAMGQTNKRLHHEVDWSAAAPCIVKAEYSKRLQSSNKTECA